MDHRCPQCKSSEEITVVVEAFADLKSDSVGNAYAVIDDDQPEWGPTSMAWCRKCEFEGTIEDFQLAAAELEEELG